MCSTHVAGVWVSAGGAKSQFPTRLVSPQSCMHVLMTRGLLSRSVSVLSNRAKRKLRFLSFPDLGSHTGPFQQHPIRSMGQSYLMWVSR